MLLLTNYFLFKDSNSCFPVLKCGILRSSTLTCSPVLGFLATRGVLVLTENAPKPLNSTRSPLAKAATIVSNTYNNGIGVITFDGDVTKIGDGAFYGRNNITFVSIPYSVKEIGDKAFACCHSIKEFTGKFAEDNGRCLIVDSSIFAYAEASSCVSDFAIPLPPPTGAPGGELPQRGKRGHPGVSPRGKVYAYGVIKSNPCIPIFFML